MEIIRNKWVRLSLLFGVLVTSALVIAFVVSRPGSVSDYLASLTTREANASALDSAIPKAVDGRKLVRSVTGQEASWATRNLHRGQLKPAADSLIATYEGDTTIWLSRYENRATAEDELEKMRQAMSRFGGGFEQLSTEPLGTDVVFVTKPKGSVQYFWRRGDVIAYISPGSASFETVKSLIKQIDERLDSLPPLVVLNNTSGP